MWVSWHRDLYQYCILIPYLLALSKHYKQKKKNELKSGLKEAEKPQCIKLCNQIDLNWVSAVPGLSGFGGKVLRKETSKNTLFETVYSAQMEALNNPDHRRLQLIRYNAQLSLHPLGYFDWSSGPFPGTQTREWNRFSDQCRDVSFHYNRR